MSLQLGNRIPSMLPSSPAMRTVVINLWGGPGVGKSSIAGQVVARLKWLDQNVELVTEVAKELVWAESKDLQDQIYIFALQQRRLRVLKGKVDIIVTDSPLPLSLIYSHEEPTSFHELIMSVFHGYNNRNYLLTRGQPYDKVGRTQTEDEAKEVDKQVSTFIEANAIEHKELIGRPNATDFIVADTITWRD